MCIFYIFKIKILEKINSAVLLEAVADLIQGGPDDGAPRSGLRKVNMPHPNPEGRAQHAGGLADLGLICTFSCFFLP